MAILEIMPEQAALPTPIVPVYHYHIGEKDYHDYEQILGYQDGKSTLELAIQNNHEVNVVEKLIHLGANPSNLRKEYFGSAYEGEGASRVGILVNIYYTKRDLINHFQTVTPLYYAISNNNVELVKILLDLGANKGFVYEINKLIKISPVKILPDIFDREKLDALTLAQRLNHEEIILLLQTK